MIRRLVSGRLPAPEPQALLFGNRADVQTGHAAAEAAGDVGDVVGGRSKGSGAESCGPNGPAWWADCT
jgi:hypothetical protein